MPIYSFLWFIPTTTTIVKLITSFKMTLLKFQINPLIKWSNHFSIEWIEIIIDLSYGIDYFLLILACFLFSCRIQYSFTFLCGRHFAIRIVPRLNVSSSKYLEKYICTNRYHRSNVEHMTPGLQILLQERKKFLIRRRIVTNFNFNLKKKK